MSADENLLRLLYNMYVQPECVLQEILETPERLRDLDLEAFSVELERQGFGQKLKTLYDIRAELNDRYKDNRPAYKPIESVERFNMLTKETPDTLYIGKHIHITNIVVRSKESTGNKTSPHAFHTVRSSQRFILPKSITACTIGPRLRLTPACLYR